MSSRKRSHDHPVQCQLPEVHSSYHIFDHTCNEDRNNQKQRSHQVWRLTCSETRLHFYKGHFSSLEPSARQFVVKDEWPGRRGNPTGRPALKATGILRPPPLSAKPPEYHNPSLFGHGHTLKGGGGAPLPYGTSALKGVPRSRRSDCPAPFITIKDALDLGFQPIISVGQPTFGDGMTGRPKHHTMEVNSREKLYPPPPISGPKAFFRGGGWGCIF